MSHTFSDFLQYKGFSGLLFLSMAKFSNSSFSSFPAALVWRLPVVYSHFKRADKVYELLYNRLAGRAIVQ